MQSCQRTVLVWIPETTSYQHTSSPRRVLYPEGDYRRVVQDRPNVTVLDLIKGIDGSDTIIEQFMEHEADTSTSRELVHRKVICVTIDCAAKFRSEFRYNGQHDAARTLVSHNTSEGLKLSIVFLELRGNTLFDVRQSCSNVVHQNLGIFSFCDS